MQKGAGSGRKSAKKKRGECKASEKESCSNPLGQIRPDGP